MKNFIPGFDLILALILDYVLFDPNILPYFLMKENYATIVESLLSYQFSIHLAHFKIALLSVFFPEDF